MKLNFWKKDEVVNFSANDFDTLPVATRNNFAFEYVESVLPNPDKVLKDNQLDLSYFKELTNDPHVHSCVQSRKAGLMSLEYDITQGESSPEITEIVQSVFKGLDVYDVIEGLLDAFVYGFQPAEIIWRVVDDMILPVKVTPKPAWWFHLDSNNLLKFKEKTNPMGVAVDMRKFVVCSVGATYDNPYGQSALSRCFYPVLFKKGGFKLWSLFVQKYGMPFLVGKMKAETNVEANQLLKILMQLNQNAVTVLPPDVDLQTIEAGANSSANYNDFINSCNNEISKAILSQTLTTENNTSVGSNAMAQTHFAVKEEVVNADKRMIEKAFNTVIRHIVDLNFFGATAPVFSMYQKNAIDLNLAERDSKLAGTGQIKFTKEYFVRWYGFAEDEFDIAVAPAPTSPQFAEPDDSVNLIIKQISDLVQSGRDFEEIQANILEAFPTLDASAFEDVFAQGVLAASVEGAIE